MNAAYARGDEALLREPSRTSGTRARFRAADVSESEQLYARLDWLAQRKELLAALARELEEAIGSMLRLAPDDPDRLLDEVAEQLLAQVSEREADAGGAARLLRPPVRASGAAAATGARRRGTRLGMRCWQGAPAQRRQCSHQLPAALCTREAA